MAGVTYKREAVDPWTDHTNEVRDGEIYVTGTCARCGDRTSWRFGKIVVTGTADADDEKTLALCDCMQPHEGRPVGQQPEGCGGYWWASENDGLP